MRTLILLAAILLGIGLFAWLLLARRIFLYIDRFFLSFVSDLPISPLEIRPAYFSIGSHIWPFPRSESPQFQIQKDSQNRLTLIAAGVSFCFGPIIKLQKADYTSDALNFTFEPDPADVVSLTQSRSRLSWPTPFEFNIMGAPVSCWRRNLYDRLLWKKSSGQTLEIIWRHEEWFFKKTGWSDTYHLSLHAVRVSGNPDE